MVLSSLPASSSRKLPALLLTFLVSINVLTHHQAKASTNISPTISAGADRSIKEQVNVALNAQAYDQDGYIVGYRWQQTKGPKVRLVNNKTASANFTAPNMLEGQSPILLVFKASAKDNARAVASDYIKITVYPNESVPNVKPTVNAGNDQTTAIKSYVELGASASDLDGNISSYQWSQTSGTSVGLVDANRAATNFISPSELTDIALTFTVTVTDDMGSQASDSVSVNIVAKNQEPSVDANVDQSVFERTEVLLSANATDEDGQINSYLWQQISGEPVSLTAASSANANFVAPQLLDSTTGQAFTFEITVTDNLGATAIDSVTINVLPSVQNNPIADCTMTINPGDSFDNAFSQLSVGDTLCLQDGLYQQAMNIPSDINVRAVNIGGPEIDGGSSLGEAWSGGLVQMKGSNSSVTGLRVHHAGDHSDACHISGTNNIMRSMSCSHGGTHKHKIPLKIGGSGHLVENSWFYGEGRYVLQCFGGDNITIRGNVIRWDKTIIGEENEPNASMSNYSCSDMIWENNISLDYGVPETYMIHCGDMCMSSTTESPNFRVQYLGNMVVNHASGTGNNKAFRADQKGTVPSSDITIKDFYVRGVGTGVTVKPQYENVTVNSCTMIDVDNIGSLDGSNINCQGDADIQFKYVDGTKTDQRLFPFANEDKIKADMCASGERQSDWCFSNKSLSDYILNR